MNKNEFLQLNDRGFLLEIEVTVCTSPGFKCEEIPSSFRVQLGQDPRTALKAVLIKAISSGEISPDEAHHVMRFSSYSVVSNLGGEIHAF